MVDIKLILSDVQMDLGDHAHEAIQRAEYVDSVNNILRKIAQRTKIWINRKIYQPNDGTGTAPVYQCAIDSADSPVALISVYRSNDNLNFLECREYGYETNMATLRDESSFKKNTSQLGKKHFHTQYRNEDTGAVDDGRYIIFNEPIIPNEFIAVDFISGRPMNVVTWDENMTLQVPDFLEDAIRYGLQWKLMERLYNRGNDSYGPRVNRAMENYDTYEREASSIANNYLHKGSSMQITPINYLPEQRY